MVLVLRKTHWRLHAVINHGKQNGSMRIKELVELWENNAKHTMTKETYGVHLTVEDAAKLKALTDAGVNVLERVQHRVKTTAHSHRYLATKASKLGHLP